jgi:enolase
MTTAITELRGRRVWDSRGRPTVEVEVALEGGARGRAIAPAGASTGTGEALDLRDGGSAFGGFDVHRALSNVTDEIAPALRGRDALDQEEIDRALVALDLHGGAPCGCSRRGGASLAALRGRGVREHSHP